MIARTILLLLLLSVSVLSYSQSISFGRSTDTVYYTEQPIVCATLYPEEHSSRDIFGLMFKLNTSCGYFEKDSIILEPFTELNYSSSYLSITDISDESISYGITGIMPEFKLEDDIDSIYISLPLSGISPDDSVLTLSLDELIVNNLNGNTAQEDGSAKTFLLVRKSGNQINNIPYYKLEGLKTRYNVDDGSISIIVPEEYSYSDYTISIYDLSGRLLLNRKIYNTTERIRWHNLVHGIYLVNVRFKIGSEYNLMSGKLIIP